MSFQEFAMQLIDQLAKLPDNWDGCGSFAPQPTALEKARRLLSLPEVNDLPAPLIYPMSDGGVQVGWHTLTRGLKLKIFQDGSVEYFLMDEKETVKGRLPLEELRAVVNTMIQR